MNIFLLGPNAVDNAAICDIGVIGYFVPVDEKTSVSSLYLPDPLEKSSNFILHALSPFEFLGGLDEVSIFFDLSCLGSDYCIISPWF